MGYKWIFQSMLLWSTSIGFAADHLHSRKNGKPSIEELETFLEDQREVLTCNDDTRKQERQRFLLNAFDQFATEGTSLASTLLVQANRSLEIEKHFLHTVPWEAFNQESMLAYHGTRNLLAILKAGELKVSHANGGPGVYWGRIIRVSRPYATTTNENDSKGMISPHEAVSGILIVYRNHAWESRNSAMIAEYVSQDNVTLDGILRGIIFMRPSDFEKTVQLAKTDAKVMSMLSRVDLYAAWYFPLAQPDIFSEVARLLTAHWSEVDATSSISKTIRNWINRR